MSGALLHNFDPNRKLFREDVRQFIWQHDPSVILVDFFDTLMVRNTDGQTIKRIACERLSHMLGLSVTGEELFARRVEEEARLCAANLAAGLDDEFRFQELAEALSSVPEFETIHSKLSRRQFIETFLDAEISTEIASQSVNRELLSALCEVGPGRRLMIVSDFYLGSEHFEKFLHAKGLTNLFERTFVSGDYLITKRSSRLYDLVKDALGLDGQHMVMIGDNHHSDVQSAARSGIPALHYMATSIGRSSADISTWALGWPSSAEAIAGRSNGKHLHPNGVQRQSTNGSSSPHRSTAVGTVANVPAPEIDEHYPSVSLLKETTPGGASEIAMILLAYLYNVGSNARRDQIGNLVFLAREGYLLRDLFETMRATISDSYLSKINVGYFYGSRRSTFLPSIATRTPISFERLFRQYSNISVTEFLLSLGFGRSEIDAISSALSFDASETIPGFAQSRQFRELRDLRLFCDTLSTRAVSQSRYLRSYFNSLIVQGDRKVALVDVGWKGTIQDNLHDVLGDDLHITGYYLGLVADSNAAIASRKRGLLFDNRSGKSRFFDLFAEVLSLWEVLCAAPHGSTVEYVESVRGRVTPRLEYADNERASFRDVVGPFQSDIHREFSALCHQITTGHLSVSSLERSAARAFWRVAFFPSDELTAVYEGAAHLENFGRFMVQDLGKYEHVAIPEPVSLYDDVTSDPWLLRRKTFWPVFYIRRYGGKLGPIITDAYRNSMSEHLSPLFAEATP